MKSLLVLLVVGLAGCASKPKENTEWAEMVPPRPTEEPRKPLVPLDLKPEWKVAALALVRAHLEDTLLTPGSAKYLPNGVPEMLCNFNPNTGCTYLFFIGEVDAQNVYGALIRRRYSAILLRDGNASETPGEWRLDTFFWHAVGGG